MTKAQIIKYWQSSAKENLQAAKDFYQTKHYSWCLFVGQLALEKLIKGLIVNNSNKNPLPIHDLKKLIQLAHIELTAKQTVELEEITKFNLEARYDDYKRRFYKKATSKYTKQWLNIITKHFLWLKKQY